MPVTQEQAAGLAVVVAITALLYAGTILLPFIRPATVRSAPFSEAGKGALAVALQIAGQEKGIYFLPPGATVADLLRAAQVQIPLAGHPRNLVKLQAGQKISLAGATSAPVLGKMTAAECLALDLPLNLNQASSQELELIPGIGAKTAARIIALRQQKKGFHALAELGEIKGIKEKKLARLRKYFSLAPL